MQENLINKNNFTLKNLKYKFDSITSENGKNWLLALNWILVLEFISSVIEYKFLDNSKSYIENIPEGIFKELFIAILIVLFIWYSIYNFIFMRKHEFFIFTLYISLCVYFLITNDFSLNLLFHNLNIFEITLSGFGFYTITELLLKFIIFYLIYKMLVAIKNRNKIS